MQTQSRFFDEMAKLMMTAAGAAQGAAREAEALMRSRLERLMGDLDLVTREEFDAMKALAQAARAETKSLSARLGALEAALKAEKARSARRADPRPKRAHRGGRIARVVKTG
jgi:BMFP domain-containing protein YqiC